MRAHRAASGRSRGVGAATSSCAALIAAAIMVACGGERRMDGGAVRSDSAGVEIVFSPEPAWDDGEAWRLAEVPELQIGRVQGDSGQVLSRIAAVRLLDSGALVVGEAAGNTVRWYGPDGTLLRTAGGTGEGPAEFVQLSGVFTVGSVVRAFGSGDGSGTVFDAGGRPVDDVRAPVDDRGPLRAVGIFRDGTVLWARYPNGQPVRRGVYEDSATLVRMGPDGALDTVARLPDTRFVEYPGRSLPLWQAYGPRLWTAVGDDVLYTGYSTRLDVAVRRPDGSVIRRIRRAGDPPPVTDEHVEAHLAALTDDVPAAAVAFRRTQHEAMIFPEHHPAHGELLPDRAGNLWVRRLDAMEEAFPTWGVPADRTRWDVFDPGGAWLGVVAMPPRFRPETIGDDRVAGVWMDSLDVEYVRVYEIAKP